MKIAIDLRSLSSGTVSGVENYTLNLLDNLLALDRQNHYTLFYNAWKRPPGDEFHFVNSKVVATRWPNRVVNLALKFGMLNLEKLAGDFDCLFMPNLNQFKISPTAKLAITVHDLSPVLTPEFYDIKRKLWHKFLNYRKAFERADVLFAVSEYTKSDLVRVFNISPSKIKVIYPAVDHKEFNPQISNDQMRLARNVYGLPGEYILFLNTIEPRKNLANLIKTFELLDHPAHLVIAGRLGWKYESDFRLVKNSKKSAKIKYIGYVEEKHKPSVIKLAKALVYPSFYEGFGFQALEAMAAGTPVIASNVTSLPEVVGDAGLLVNPYSAQDISGALKQVLTNPALANQLTLKGMLKSRDFNWASAAKKTLDALNGL